MFRVLTLSLFLAPTVLGQIVTDRPDLTESTEAVSGVQLETGLLIEADDRGAGNGSLDVSGPQALVRVGVVPGVEVRLGLPDYVVVGADAEGLGGFSDPSVGAKVELGTVGPWAFAGIAEVSLPLGDDGFSGAASPLALLVAGRDLGTLALGTQAEALWDRNTDRVEVGGTLVLGAGLTERVGAFAEIAGGSTPDGGAVVVQVGSTLLLSPDVQLDAFLGAGATDPAPDVFGGIGFSARF